MRNIFKTLLVVMVLVLAIAVVTSCDAHKEPTTPKTCEHTGGEATCTAAAVCEKCGESYGEKLAHTVATKEAVAATCTEPGMTEGSYCSVCDEVIVAQEEIPALGHTEEVVPGKAATCTATGLTEGKKCSVCEEILLAQEEISSLGHKDENSDFICDVCEADLCTDHSPADPIIENDVPATCQKPGSYDSVVKCSVCGDEISRESKVHEKLPHTEEAVPGKAATCTATGLTEGKKCSVCGETLLAQEEISVLGHTEEVVPGKAATCTSTGLKDGKKCSVCGETLLAQEEIAVLGHTEEVVPGKAATCTSTGLKDGKKCSVCGETLLAQEEIPVAAHTPGAEATCTAPQTCTACGEILAVALAHNYVNGTCDVCKTSVIYFVNVEKWAKVNAYMWNSTNNGWPGAAMTKTNEQVHGFDIYEIEFTDAYVNVIFNNGSEQTADLVIEKGKYFCPLNSIWYNSADEVPSFEGITKTNYYLPGGFNSWKDANAFLKEGSSTIIRSYVVLAANTTYEFKVKTGSTWYGSTGTISATSTTITFSSTGTNAKIKTACAGLYVFEYDTSTKKLTAIYPHTEEVVPGKAATCTETGLTEGKKCSACGTVTLKQEILPIVDHAWDDAEAIIRTCATCGLVENTHFAGGQGTAEDPYLIANAEQLMNISKYYDTYYYYKVADGVSTIDMDSYGKVSLHGSFDGNGVKLVNLRTALFLYVGYENSAESIKISNLEATMNSIDGCAFVRNIFNSGKTTFENVQLHGYVEGLYNMGSFYNYGTANYDDIGANYTVEFINSTSDITLVCTSGNGIGGMIGHGYEGKDNVLSIIRDDASVYTGTMYTTNGSVCDSLMYMCSNTAKFILNDVETSGYDASFNYSSTKIASVKPTTGADGYVIAPVDGANKIVVYLNAQVTAHDADGFKVPNLSGMTWPLGNATITELGESVKVFDLITSASIVNGTDHGFGYVLDGGILTLYSGRSASYESGNVFLQVNQYDAEGNLLATGTITVYVIEHNHTFIGGSCTTLGVCNCGTKQKTLYDHTEEILPAKAPTCEATGLTEGKKCSVCGATLLAQEEIAALGHAYSTSYAWSDDNSTCTAKDVCANDPTHVANEETATVSVVTLNVSATKVTYTYKVEFAKFDAQSKVVEGAVALENNIATINAPAIAGRTASHEYVKFGFHDATATYTFDIYYSEIDLWDGTSVSESLSGSGTEEDPYLIQSGADLAYIAKVVNEAAASTANFKGQYFKMTKSIDLNGKALMIGSYSGTKYFHGFFDGNNCAIKGINATQSLFGGLKDGYIKNLAVYGSVKTTEKKGVAGLVSYMSVATVENITNYVNVTGIQQVAGVVGWLENNTTTFAKNCVNYGTITATSYQIGGIAGFAKGSFSDCTNFGNVSSSGSGYVGGVGGAAKDAKGSRSNCVNYGNISGTDYVGGVFGQITKTTTNCYSYGTAKTVTTGKNVGEVVGSGASYLVYN